MEDISHSFLIIKVSKIWPEVSDDVQVIISFSSATPRVHPIEWIKISISVCSLAVECKLSRIMVTHCFDLWFQGDQWSRQKPLSTEPSKYPAHRRRNSSSICSKRLSGTECKVTRCDLFTEDFPTCPIPNGIFLGCSLLLFLKFVKSYPVLSRSWYSSCILSNTWNVLNIRLSGGYQQLCLPQVGHRSTIFLDKCASLLCHRLRSSLTRFFSSLQNLVILSARKHVTYSLQSIRGIWKSPRCPGCNLGSAGFIKILLIHHHIVWILLNNLISSPTMLFCVVLFNSTPRHHNPMYFTTRPP